jgi:hypothetical protein
MPYTRAYEFKVEEAKEMVNVVPSVNWLQETLTLASLTVKSSEKCEKIVSIGKSERAYARLIEMQQRADYGFKVTVQVSNAVPNSELIKRWTAESKGDQSIFDELRKEWEASVYRLAARDLDQLICVASKEEVSLVYASLFPVDGIESVRLTVWSPSLPTRGDLPITAIYVPWEEDRVTTIQWTDRSGFLSTLRLVGGQTYPIQPVSFMSDSQVFLLA